MGQSTERSKSLGAFFYFIFNSFILYICKIIPHIMAKHILLITILIFYNQLYSQDVSIQKVPDLPSYTSGQSIKLISNLRIHNKYYAQPINSIANKINRYKFYFNSGCPFGKFKYNLIPFDIPNTNQNSVWEALSSAANNSNPVSITLKLKCPTIVDTAYTLINTDYGSTDRSALIKFNFVGGTSQSVIMYGGNQFRDWNEYGGPNSCSSPLTYQIWSSDPNSSISSGGSYTSKRLDMQKIPVNSANKLQSITLVDSGSDISVQRIFLSGLSFHTKDSIKTEWRVGSPAGVLLSSSDSVIITPSLSTTYYLVNQNGCYDSIRILIPTINSIQTHETNIRPLNLSYDPSIGLFKISYYLPSKTTKSYMVMSDIVGRIIHRVELAPQPGENMIPIDLKKIENQLIIVSLISDNSILTRAKFHIIK
ncbi:MAG: hypothetical protein ACK567_04145 [Chitinophagales bacterium]|jgi:hypothetical protein